MKKRGRYELITGIKVGELAISLYTSGDLTRGRAYVVLKQHYHNSGLRSIIEVRNDNGNVCHYDQESYFISVVDSRSLKLKEIGYE